MGKCEKSILLLWVIHKEASVGGIESKNLCYNSCVNIHQEWLSSGLQIVNDPTGDI